MKAWHGSKKFEVLLVLSMALFVFISNFSYSVMAQAGNSKVLLIVGDQTDASPLSNIELEICHKEGEGVGRKVGTFISQKEENGDGHIWVELTQGEYFYRTLTEGYRLPSNQDWEPFEIEEDTQTLLIWVVSGEEAMASEEEVIEDEEIAQGSPELKKEQPKEKEEVKAASIDNEVKKSESNMSLSELKIGDFKLNIVNNVWLTLGILALLIFGIIGLDYFASKRN